MSFFDVVSLFTNAPIAETINTIVEKMYNRSANNDEKPNSPIKPEIIEKLMFVATQGILMYKQMDGVTMVFLLGPTLANFFLGHIEKQLFDT